jgi:hypothetical protein
VTGYTNARISLPKGRLPRGQPSLIVDDELARALHNESRIAVAHWCDSSTSLVKKIDAATVNNKVCKMGSFFVFLNDDENFDKKLKDLAEKEEPKKQLWIGSGDGLQCG